MKKIIAIFLVLGLLTLGCISGEVRHDIKADGTDHIEVEFDKSGMLKDVDCDSLYSSLESTAEGNEEELERIKNMECKETEDSLILKGLIKMGEEDSKVTIVEKEGIEYLRFEDERGILDTKVTMPAKITSTNGIEKEDNKVLFSAIDMKDIGEGPETIYAECEKPGMCGLPIFLLGSILFLAVIRFRA